jgi:magnesium transporter
MSKASHQMNAIMQRLSVVSAIFMPLTFIVGLYGMNIEGIPELHWPGFYYFLLGFMALIVVLLLILFKKLKWY